MKNCQLPFIHTGKKCSRTLRTAEYCYEAARLKAFAIQARVQPKRKKKKGPPKKKAFKQIDEISSKWEFPLSAHPCSHRHYRHSKSCCLWNWQAVSGRAFDLSRNHYDALNWYRFVPHCCRSSWNIWSTVSGVNLWKVTCRGYKDFNRTVTVFLHIPQLLKIVHILCYMLHIFRTMNVFILRSHCFLFNVSSIENAVIRNLLYTVNLLQQIFFDSIYEILIYNIMVVVPMKL